MTNPFVKRVRAYRTMQLVFSCPGIGKASYLAQEVTKNALIDFLLHENDPEGPLEDECYYSHLVEAIYDEDGMIRTSLGMYNEQEWWNFIADPSGNFRNTEYEVQRLLCNTLYDNRDLINTAYRELDFQVITAMSTLPNHLVFKVFGATYDHQLALHTYAWDRART